MTAINKLKVPLKKMRFYPELKQFEGLTTKDFKSSSHSLFHKEGFSVLDFGISIRKRGFNIFVTGESGTGKTSGIKSRLKEIAKTMKRPNDLCYVFNFEEEDRPNLISLNAGEGEKFVKDIDDLRDYFIHQIPKQLESESFEIQKGEIVKWHQDESENNYKDIEQQSAELNFSIQSTESGLVINPVVDGKPIDKTEFEKLSAKEQKAIRTNEEKLQEKLIAFFHKERLLDKEYKEKMTMLQQSMIKLIISEPIEEIKETYNNNKMIVEYLEQLKDYTIQSFEDFFIYRDLIEGKADPSTFEMPDFNEYKVNLLVNNKHSDGAPVIYETNPTFQNIMGYFEYEEIRNSLFTDFTKLKPGALHKANGGFLILQANDLLKNYYAWTALKRALRNRTLKMEEIESDFKYRVNITPKPKEVPLDLKVLLIGDEEVYHMLYNYDEDFRRIFRVKADFDSNAKVNSKNIKYLIEFISRIVKEDCSLDFDMSAIRRIIFHASKKAEDQKKIRIHSGELVDIIIESDFWAKKAKKKIVSEEFVKKAIENREKRHGKVKDYYLESIERDTILIETKKAEVGKINGLAVYSIGDYSFGLPSRITARVFAGKRGIINIDREVRLSGSIHDKGSMILAGFIGGVFAQDKTLGISASITFEQSYGGVDGDSASSTELYVLLSALGNVPIKQSIAVTGSINQMGEIQPIGGVNEKVEGFFEICKMKGFAKEGNGVIIPIQNVENLNLSDEVIEAVKKGIFTIYAIKSVYEGIEILTGLKAGERKKDGSFTKNSVFEKVNQRIIELNNIK